MGYLALVQAEAQMMQAGLEFRYAMLEEVGEIVSLVNSAYRGDSSRQGWTTEADLLDGQRTDSDEVSDMISRHGSIILLAYQQELLIGTVHLQKIHDAAAIGMLVIRPGMQGNGWGRQLLQEAENRAKAMWGVSKLQMQVISVRDELIAYYLRRGYRRSGEFKAFPDDIRYGIPKRGNLQLVLLEKNAEL